MALLIDLLRSKSRSKTPALEVLYRLIQAKVVHFVNREKTEQILSSLREPGQQFVILRLSANLGEPKVVESVVDIDNNPHHRPIPLVSLSEHLNAMPFFFQKMKTAGFFVSCNLRPVPIERVLKFLSGRRFKVMDAMGIAQEGTLKDFTDEGVLEFLMTTLNKPREDLEGKEIEIYDAKSKVMVVVNDPTVWELTPEYTTLYVDGYSLLDNIE